MRLAAFWRLLGTNLRRNARRLILGSLGIVVGIGSFVFFISLGNGVRHIIVRELIGGLPVNQIEVAPKSYNVGITKQSSLFAMKFDDDMLERFRSIPGVKSVFGKMNLRVPSRAVIPIPKSFQKRGLASAFYTELLVQGIDPSAIPKSDIKHKEFKYSKKGRIPVLISKRLLDLYNATLAEVSNFPKLNAQAARLIPPFNITVGASAFQRRNHPKGPKHYPAQIVGVSSRAIMVGISVPLGYIKQINSFYRGKNGGQRYNSAIVETAKPEQIPGVLKKLDKLGFSLSDRQILAKKVGEIILLITVLLSIISGVIMLIAAISISHTFFMMIYERRYEIGLMRAVGAHRSTIRRLVMIEATVVGVLSGIAGIAMTLGITRLMQWGLESYPDLPFTPSKLFQYPLWLPLLALGFAMLFCLFGAFFPARRAAAMDPATVLKGL